MKNYIYIAAIGLTVLASCKKTAFEERERTNGKANFKHYISVGNSLTQGFQDGGLYAEGQSMSYPSIIAKQMAKVQPNMDDFLQPIAAGKGSGYMHLGIVNGALKPINSTDPSGYQENVSWSSWGTAEKSLKYNNLGIAGVKLVQCVNLSANDRMINPVILGGITSSLLTQEGNPYARFMDFGEPSLLGTPIAYLEHVKKSNATFFTNWLGNNDVLGYVANGGVSNVIGSTTLNVSVDLNALSDLNEFEQKYDSITKAFYDMGASGISATIPNVTSIPYVTTFTLSKLKADYNYTDVWITENDGSSVRKATDEDYILLGASSSISAGVGHSMTNPFLNGNVLDRDEVSLAKNHTLALNNIIRTIASKYGYPVVDMFTYMDNLSAGFTFDGIDMNAQYIQGGTFSLDGIHPNPRGYAVVANEFIRVINAHYESNIPKVSIGNYRGVKFP